MPRLTLQADSESNHVWVTLDGSITRFLRLGDILHM